MLRLFEAHRIHVSASSMHKILIFNYLMAFLGAADAGTKPSAVHRAVQLSGILDLLGLPASYRCSHTGGFQRRQRRWPTRRGNCQGGLEKVLQTLAPASPSVLALCTVARLTNLQVSTHLLSLVGCAHQGRPLICRWHLWTLSESTLASANSATACLNS